MRGVPEYALERLVAASCERAWRCWTEPSLFSQWYGPNVETVIHKMDVRPDGESLIELKWENNSLFQKFQYLEVTPFSKLTWLFTLTDENWNIIPSPLAENWPTTLITNIKLEPQADATLLHLSWTPLNATEAEIRCFTQSRLDIDAGWNAGLNKLDGVIEGQKNKGIA